MRALSYLIPTGVWITNPRNTHPPLILCKRKAYLSYDNSLLVLPIKTNWKRKCFKKENLRSRNSIFFTFLHFHHKNALRAFQRDNETGTCAEFYGHRNVNNARSNMDTSLSYVFECPKISKRVRCKPAPNINKKEMEPLLKENCLGDGGVLKTFQQTGDRETAIKERIHLVAKSGFIT